MTTRVWSDHTRFYKRFDSCSEAEAAVSRARWLRAAGIPTPAAERSGTDHVVAFRRITGQSGREIVGAVPATHCLAPLLDVVARLHALPPAEGLGRFDPLAKIGPRLRAGGDHRLRSAIAAIMSGIVANPSPCQTLHGDLHVGQLIMDDEGTVWIIDLDDMAGGDAAADLGNFAAHLASRTCESATSPMAAMRNWLGIVLRDSHVRFDAAFERRGDAFGRLALIRRALKHRDRGDVRLLSRLLDDGLD